MTGILFAFACIVCWRLFLVGRFCGQLVRLLVSDRFGSFRFGLGLSTIKRQATAMVEPCVWNLSISLVPGHCSMGSMRTADSVFICSLLGPQSTSLLNELLSKWLWLVYLHKMAGSVRLSACLAPVLC